MNRTATSVNTSAAEKPLTFLAILDGFEQMHSIRDCVDVADATEQIKRMVEDHFVLWNIIDHMSHGTADPGHAWHCLRLSALRILNIKCDEISEYTPQNSASSEACFRSAMLSTFEEIAADALARTH